MLLGAERGLDLRADLLRVLGDLDCNVVQHVLGFGHDRIQSALPVHDLEHVRLQLRGHVGLGDASAVVLERLRERYTARRGDHVVALDVVPGVQLPDDVVPGGLGSELEPVHLLDQRTLVVPVGGLCLRLHDGHGPDVDRVPDLEGRELAVVGLHILAVVLLPALLLEDVPLGVEVLPADVYDALGDLRLGVRCDRGQEPPDYQLVQLPLVPLHLVGGRAGGGVYGRMVRGPPLSLGGDDLLLGEDLLGLRFEVPVLELLEDRPQVEGLGVLGVLGTGV